MDWPQQAKVHQTMASNATVIRKAFKTAFDTEAIVQAWEESHPTADSMTPQGARDWALAHVHAKRKPLEESIDKCYANGYVLGDKIARARLLGMVALKSVSAGVIDWSNWTPGMESAAALLKPKGGLKWLLDREKITIADDIIHTKIDRIGTALYNGLEKGYSPAKIGQMIDSIIDDPEHALMIARTETARAMSVATRDSYKENNVEMVEWLVADGCDDCQENADASPIGINDVFPTGDTEPPAHPNCMCAIAPYFDDSDLPQLDEGNDDGGYE